MSSQTPPIDPELLAILRETDEPSPDVHPGVVAEIKRRLADPADDVWIPWEQAREMLIARVQANAAARAKRERSTRGAAERGGGGAGRKRRR
jgi:hypothetical protein